MVKVESGVPLVFADSFTWIAFSVDLVALVQWVASALTPALASAWPLRRQWVMSAQA